MSIIINENRYNEAKSVVSNLTFFIHKNYLSTKVLECNIQLRIRAEVKKKK